MINPFPLSRHRGRGGRRRITIRWSRWWAAQRPVSAQGGDTGAAVDPRRPVRRAVRTVGFAPGSGAGRVLGFDRGAGLGVAGCHRWRHRPGPAADHGDAQGHPGVAAVAGRPGGVCVAAAVSGAAVRTVPTGRDEPLWWTLRRPFRALSYDAARVMFTRANAGLGSNWSLHDLRHTAAYRMARDRQMPLTDVQWVLGHGHLSTTQRYLSPVTEEVIAGVLAFHARQRDRDPAAPAAQGIPAGELAYLVRRGQPVVTTGDTGLGRRRLSPRSRRPVSW